MKSKGEKTTIDEEKWQKRWEKAGLYRAIDLDKKRGKEYILVEFPYPSGEGLHIGHAFTFTGADVYARQRRMEGKNVLFPMGWDAFGLPTENFAIKTGIHPQKVTERNTANFRRQMKKMAFSFDWSREINTTDPAYYRWTQWIFIKLFENGLAYKKAMPVNWCPSCKIGLANEEVVNGRCERCGATVSQRKLEQWIVKITDYAERLLEGLNKVDFIEKVKAAQINWIGKSEGAKIKFSIASHSEFISGSILNQVQDDGKGVVQDDIKEIEVFTTRPDTLWGATFIVLAPEHPLVAALLNSKLNPPAGGKNSELQKIDEYVEGARKKSDLERTDLAKEKTGVFTGLYAVNPATGKKIPVWVSDFVLESYGSGAIMGVPAHDERDWQFAKKFGLPIIPVVEPRENWDFDKGAYTQVEKGKMINSGFLNGLSPKEAIKETIAWLEKKKIGEKAVSYHLRDWIFSRQHYWGEPIPMIYCPSCAKKGITWWDSKKSQNSIRQLADKSQKFQNFNLRELAGWFPVPEEDLPVELPKVEKYQPTGTGESPLASVPGWREISCPVCGQAARRETDTMPNWAGSDWYYLAYCFADKLTDKQKSQNVFMDNKDILSYWLPVDIYFGGDEHNTLHLLYSRFIYQFLYDLGFLPRRYPEPYYRRVSHGMVLGADGQKMSKSRGNVINPDEVWGNYGVDALRLYLMFMGPYEGTTIWNENAFQGTVRFLRRFEKKIREDMKVAKEEGKKLRPLFHRLTKKVSEDIKHFKYNTAVAALMEALNKIEEEELVLTKKEMETMVKLIAPFAPYLAEELWTNVLGNPFSVHQQEWPTYDPRKLEEKMTTIIVQINGKTRGKIDIESDKANAKDAVILAVKREEKIKKYLSGQKIKKVVFLPGRLINFVI
ncbi:MAG: leucine--tRNA ligase [Patescibacteria group bacterium]|jgi:leucyl-tRNA synthetase